MGFVAVFEVRVGGERGVSVALDVATKLQPFEVTIDDHRVRVVPVVVDHTDEDYIGPEGEPVVYEVPFLDALRAEVTIESDATTLAKADIAKFFGSPRRAAAEAFRLTLAHLRSVTGDVSVSVTPHLWRAKEYRDGSGAVVKQPLWLSFADVSLPEPVNELGLSEWARVTDAVENGERVPIGHEWLLDARVFHEAHNYNMAVAAAAVACEVYGYELVRRHLSQGNRISNKGLTKFLEGVSRRDLFPTLFRYFGIADADTAEEIVRVLNERNQIIHGKQKRQVPESRGVAALRMAEFLESALSK